MTSYRVMKPTDLFNLNMVNLDVYTENYNVRFYFRYFHQWPQYNIVAETIDGKIVGYVMGKSEGVGKNWHGHVTVLTVSPQYRQLGIASTLMRHLEETAAKEDCYFVDLFVRMSNETAINMYKKLGYTVYRRVIDYYSEPREDAYDMRKALPRDTLKQSVVPLKHPIHADDLEVY